MYFSWGFTSYKLWIFKTKVLWIDFNLYFYVRIHKVSNIFYHTKFVVNWFQFVFLREDSQVAFKRKGFKFSCELISICIFTWGFTSDRVINNNRPLLWIDFNLYFYVRIHKFKIIISVVNFLKRWLLSTFRFFETTFINASFMFYSFVFIFNFSQLIMKKVLIWPLI